MHFLDLFTMICSQGQSLLLCHASMRGSHPLPDQLPGEHTGHMPQAVRRSYLYNRLDCCHSHTHSHMVTADRSTVVGHVPTVHTCSFYVHQSHRHDSTHPGLFTSWGALPSSRLPSCKQRIAGLFFFFRNFLTETFSHGEIRTRDLPLGKQVP